MLEESITPPLPLRVLRVWTDGRGCRTAPCEVLVKRPRRHPLAPAARGLGRPAPM